MKGNLNCKVTISPRGRQIGKKRGGRLADPSASAIRTGARPSVLPVQPARAIVFVITKNCLPMLRMV